MVPDASPIRRCQCRTCQDGSDLAIMEHHHTINLILSRLTEPQRRWYVASLTHGPHAFSLHQLARITGLDRQTIRRGRQELADGLADLPPQRLRREGAGQKAAEKKIRRSKR